MCAENWQGYVPADLRFEFSPNAIVLDAGCGSGGRLAEITHRGCWGIGVDLDRDALRLCRQAGLRVVAAKVEHLPFGDGSVEAFLCKVVLPYTDESKAVNELARVLAVGGTGYIVGHGAGYYLRYVLRPPPWKQVIYGFRSIVSTWLRLLTGRTLPGWLGDTMYQSRRRLEGYYAGAGLIVDEDMPSRRFLGLPVFIYQKVRRVEIDPVQRNAMKDDEADAPSRSRPEGGGR